MSVKIVVDMNLFPEWVSVPVAEGCEVVHWSVVGNPRASDAEIMDWARKRGFVVFTHDLDFGAALALTHVAGPSVIQVRRQNVLPGHMSPLVLSIIRRYDEELNSGALVVVDENRSRLRVLPF